MKGALCEELRRYVTLADPNAVSTGSENDEAILLAPSYGDITSYLTARKFLFCSYTKKGRPERPPSAVSRQPSAEELAQNETA
jgi:hypothetical protein